MPKRPLYVLPLFVARRAFGARTRLSDNAVLRPSSVSPSSADMLDEAITTLIGEITHMKGSCSPCGVGQDSPSLGSTTLYL